MVSSFRRLLSSLSAKSSKRKSLATRRSWVSTGVERLEDRQLFACLPASDLSFSGSGIDENLPAGTTAGEFAATDFETLSEPLVFSFEGGPQNLDNENFFLTGNVLKTRSSFDFESQSSYQVAIKGTDTAGQSMSRMFTINVNDLQENPITADDAVLTTPNSPVSGNVLANDSDDTGDMLTAVLNSQPEHGVVELAEDGSFVYTPSLDYEGSDSFTYRAEDGRGGSTIATVTIVIDPINDAPISGADAYSTDEDVPVSGNVLVNDTDADGDAIAATLENAPAHGTVELNSDGSFVYTPAADFSGEDSFTYLVDDGHGLTSQGVVTLTIAPLNDAPVVGDDTFATAEDVALAGNVLANDSDADGDSLQAALVEGPVNGTVELNADGSFVYTPAADFYGEDSFSYVVSDGLGGTMQGVVSIAIEAVNDVPVVGDDAFATEEDTAVAGNVLANDTDADGDAVSAAIENGPAHGTVELNADGSFVYTPAADYFGEDSFTYVASDGLGGTMQGVVTIAIQAVNDLPVVGDDTFATDEDVALSGNVLANDSDIDGDSLQATLAEGPTHGTVELNADGSFVYTPEADYFGEDSFTYVASDGAGGTMQGAVKIAIAAVNDGPLANDDAFATQEDVALSIPIADLLANDTDSEGEPLQFLAAGGSINGTVAVQGMSVVFTPNADFNGTGTFTYAVQDSSGAIAMATVTIGVEAMADAPVAVDDNATTEQGIPLTISASWLTANDTDAEGDPLTVTAVGKPSGGTVSMTEGTITFVPDAGFQGTASFHYVVNDGNGGNALGRVVVEVTPIIAPNTAPQVIADSVSATQGNAAMINAADLLANDLDADGDSLLITAVSDAVGGSVSLANNQVTFQPNAGFVGMATFSYEISDGHGGTAIGQVTVDVEAAASESPTDGDNEDGTSFVCRFRSLWRRIRNVFR